MGKVLYLRLPEVADDMETSAQSVLHYMNKVRNQLTKED